MRKHVIIVLMLCEIIGFYSFFNFPKLSSSPKIDKIKYRLGEKYVVNSKTRLFIDICVVVTATAVYNQQ
ncbi:hypothetical protein HZS_6621 [Henneguya salminicola]|nr:hypothetical protein HZS_6621 [Henneguya salminicola]